MKTINKDEADYIRAHSTEACITVTGKQKSGRAKKRYIDEMPESLRLLDEFRKSRIVK